MVMVKVVREYEVEAPEGATHFSGDLLGGKSDPPKWWKHSANSTGTVRGWWFWNTTKKCWHFGRESEPDTLPNQWTKKLQEVNP